MPRYKSPLRYPGGKLDFAPFLRDLIVVNDLSDGIYAEAYCGGASAALELLFGEIVQEIYINDADYQVFAFWEAILKDTDAFLQKLWNVPTTIDEWWKHKQVLQYPENHSSTDVGFAAFYLNRCNHSGILTGGPIGGYQQSGTWKLDARFTRKDLSNRIERIALYEDRIHPSSLDALDFLQRIVKLNGRLFAYLDPPYYSMGDRLYLNYYTPDDHRKLAKYLENTRLKWVLSYDDVPQIRALYPTLRKKKTNVVYHAHLRKRGNELIIFSPDLQLSTA